MNHTLLLATCMASLKFSRELKVNSVLGEFSPLVHKRLFPLPLDEVLPKTVLHYFLRLLLLLFPFRGKKKCSEKVWPVLLVLIQPPILIAGEQFFFVADWIPSHTTKLLVSISSLRKCSVNLISIYRANGITNIQCQTLFWGAPKSLQMVTAAMKLKDAYSLEGKL